MNRPTIITESKALNWCLERAEITSQHTGEYDGQIVTTTSAMFRGRLPHRMVTELIEQLKALEANYRDHHKNVSYTLSTEEYGIAVTMGAYKSTRNNVKVTYDHYQIEEPVS